jgi:hypothetical protein
MNLILFLVRVNFFTVIDFDGEIEGLVLDLLTLHIGLTSRGTTRWLALLLLSCLLSTSGL